MSTSPPGRHQGKRFPRSDLAKGLLAFVAAILLQVVSTLWLEGATAEPFVTIHEVLHAGVLIKVLLVVAVLYVAGTDLLKETFAEHLHSTSDAFLGQVETGAASIENTAEVHHDGVPGAEVLPGGKRRARPQQVLAR